jgi:hypothetical protein
MEALCSALPVGMPGYISYARNRCPVGARLWQGYHPVARSTMYVTRGDNTVMGGTHRQVAPLCAVLEDPETPVLTEIRDLISRVVVRPKAVFRGQTRILWAESDNVLRVTA